MSQKRFFIYDFFVATSILKRCSTVGLGSVELLFLFCVQRKWQHEDNRDVYPGDL